MIIPASKNYIPLVTLIAGNLVPLFGVVFFGWRVFEIVMLFWLETVIVAGIFTIWGAWRVIRAGGGWFGALLLLMVAYAVNGLCWGVGTFFAGILNGDEIRSGPGGVSLLYYLLVDKNLWFAGLVLLFSHIFNFISMHIFERSTEWKKALNMCLARTLILVLLLMPGIMLAIGGVEVEKGVLFLMIGMKAYSEFAMYCRENPELRKQLAWMFPKFVMRGTEE